jgi:endonuclease G
VAGPIYLESKVSRTIGESKVAIPDAFFKIILCLKGNPKAIGFVYKNDFSCQSIKSSYCSVDYIENLIGYDFFTSLEDSIEVAIEAKCEINYWK